MFKRHLKFQNKEPFSRKMHLSLLWICKWPFFVFSILVCILLERNIQSKQPLSLQKMKWNWRLTPESLYIISEQQVINSAAVVYWIGRVPSRRQSQIIGIADFGSVRMYHSNMVLRKFINPYHTQFTNFRTVFQPMQVYSLIINNMSLYYNVVYI